MLEADRPQQSGALKAVRLVQPDGGRIIAVADNRDHLAIAERRASLDQRRQQDAADAPTVQGGVHIDRILKSPS